MNNQELLEEVQRLHNKIQALISAHKDTRLDIVYLKEKIRKLQELLAERP